MANTFVRNYIAAIAALALAFIGGCIAPVDDANGGGNTTITCLYDNDLDGSPSGRIGTVQAVRCEDVDHWLTPEGDPTDCNDNDVRYQSNCPSPKVTCYFDEDRDNHGVGAPQTFDGTNCPGQWSVNVGDCAPTDPAKFDNCVGPSVTCFRDQDLDGVSTSTSQTFPQATCPSGWLPNQGADCDDTDRTKQYNCNSCNFSTIEAGTAACSDGCDNDNDGKTDQQDPSCQVCAGNGELLGEMIGIEFHGLPTGLRTLGGQSVTNTNLTVQSWGCSGSVPTACSVYTSCYQPLSQSCNGWLAWAAVQGDSAIEANFVSWDGHLGKDAEQMGIRIFVRKNGVTTQLPGSISRMSYDPTCARAGTYQGIDPSNQGDRLVRIMTPVRLDCAGGTQMTGTTPPDRYNGGTCN